jgi:hypothetical protein
MHLKKDEEPTATEMLAVLLVELMEDANPAEPGERARRFSETLAAAQNAIDERIEHALQRTTP